MKDFDQRLNKLFTKEFEEHKQFLDKIFAGCHVKLDRLLEYAKRMKADVEEIKDFLRTHK